MSAASVAAQPLTTTYVQAPSRFDAVSPSRRGGQTGTERVGPMAATFRRHQTSDFASSQQHSAAVTLREGMVPRVTDRLPNPISLGGSSAAISPTRRAANPNSRTSAGFTLGLTAQQRAEADERREYQAMLQAEETQRAQTAFEEEETRRAQRQPHSHTNSFAQQHQPQQQQQPSESSEQPQFSPSHSLDKAAYAALYAKQRRDPKLSYRDRMVPPKPDLGGLTEDPITSRAAEHTGRYPGPTHRPPPYKLTHVADSEPAAAEGSLERLEQKRRVNPLLDPRFQHKSDACGLGYGRKHQQHFRYLAHTGPELVGEGPTGGSANLHAYRSKAGLGYRDEVRGIGGGHEHPTYNWAVSVQRVEDILPHYPDVSQMPSTHLNREAFRKYFNRQ